MQQWTADLRREASIDQVHHMFGCQYLANWVGICPKEQNHPISKLLVSFRPDLPASLLEKFNAAAGNHSKKPRPYIVDRSRKNVCHSMSWLPGLFTANSIICCPRFELLKEFLLADEMSIPEFCLLIVWKFQELNFVIPRRDVKVDAAVKQQLVCNRVNSFRFQPYVHCAMGNLMGYSSIYDQDSE